jgi:glucosamine--fructose-6-phosphate aminotransferase (isomerizing)
LAITNYGEEPLAGLGDLALVIPAGQEHSVAQTRSFASMYLAAAAFAMVAGGQTTLLKQIQALPVIGQRLIARYADLARQAGENLLTDRFYFLGSGCRYGLACEVNLKMKEMTLTPANPFISGISPCGPMSMVSPNTLIVGLLSERNRVHEQAVLDEMDALGGIRCHWQSLALI